MTLVFLGILAFAFSWIRTLPVFAEPQGATTWVVAGVVFLVVGFRNVPLWEGPLKREVAVAVLVCSLVGALWLTGPFRFGFVLFAMAAVLALTPVPRDVARWLLPGMWASGAVYVVQAAFVPLLWVFSARYHDTAELPVLHDALPGFPAVPWLTYLLYVPLKLVNPGLALNGSTLYLHTALDTQPLTPTWEKLGLFPFALFFVGAAVVILLRPDWRRQLLGLFLCVIAYAYVRVLVLFLAVNQFRSETVFWRFDYVFYSFVLLPLLLGAWWRFSSRRRETPTEETTARRNGILGRIAMWVQGSSRELVPFRNENRWFRIVIASVLFAGGLASYWGFHDPGSAKQGRVLIDEKHSNWEWTTQPFDTTWYGGRSGYNYYCLAEYWDHYYHVETRRDSLTSELLKEWDVLVLKTPTSPFSQGEIDAIEKFVREGGGLYLIGDHTNVFGTSTYLNPVAERFGMYFRYDATYNLVGLGLSVYERPKRFAHPVVRFMPEYMFATSCTLYSPLLSENVILGYGLRAMYLDYSETSYFPTKEEKFDYDFGLFVQAGGVKYGRGRVLGYTDSTCFSNFFMFIPGKPELALASIEWLNRGNRWAWVNRFFLVVALGGLVLLVVEARRNTGPGFWNTAIASGTLAVVVLAAVFDGSVKKHYPLPAPRRPVAHVTFDQRHGNYALPVETLPVTNWQDFQTFYVWTQRVGLVPRNETTVRDAVKDSRALIEIQPCKPFTIEEIDLIVDLVRSGGTLVVLDSPENSQSTARSLLGPFNISFENDTADSVAVLDEHGDTLGIARKAYAVKEVTPLWRLADGRVTMGYRAFEKGKVIVCGAAYLFSSEVMGSTAVVPNEKQRRIYRAEYALFQNLAGIDVTDRHSTAAPSPEPSASSSQ